MQRSGSFKGRGASYKLSRLKPQEYERGVIAASAGNHAQGGAIAAAQYHIPCTIVMPETAPLAKVMATQDYGAAVVLHGFTYDDAYPSHRYLNSEKVSDAEKERGERNDTHLTPLFHGAHSLALTYDRDQRRRYCSFYSGLSG